jgi:hypothetical protein
MSPLHSDKGAALFFFIHGKARGRLPTKHGVVFSALGTLSLVGQRTNAAHPVFGSAAGPPDGSLPATVPHGVGQDDDAISSIAWYR